MNKQELVKKEMQELKSKKRATIHKYIEFAEMQDVLELQLEKNKKSSII
jgi:uncharacterized protein VirK/YbjX